VSSKIFVGNLNFDTNESGIREHFATIGTITDIHIPTNRDTGRPRGFAFVTFSSEDEAENALQSMQGAELDGRPLRIDRAQERPRRPGGGGPRFDGGGGPGFGGGPPRGGGGRGRRGPPPGDDFGGGGGDYRGFDGGPDFGGDGYGGGGDFGGGGGGGDFGDGRKFKKGGGSRRGLRARKRSL